MEGPSSQHRHLSRDLQLEIRPGQTQGSVSLPNHRDSRRGNTRCPPPHLSSLLQSQPQVGKAWGASRTPASARAPTHRQPLSDTCQPQAPQGSRTRTVGSLAGNWGHLIGRMECTPHSPELQGYSACSRLPYTHRQTHKPLAHTLLHTRTPPLGQSPPRQHVLQPHHGACQGVPTGSPDSRLSPKPHSKAAGVNWLVSTNTLPRHLPSSPWKKPWKGLFFFSFFFFFLKPKKPPKNYYFSHHFP